MNTWRNALSLVLLASLCACGPRPPAGGGGSTASSPTPAAAATPAATTVVDSGAHLTLSADDVHIDYRVYGQGEPAVVLIHCWACDANYWRGQVTVLASRYTVVTVNLAGHGASGANRSDWSIARYAQDVAAVAHQIPNGKLILVGHSMGAAVALTAAALLGTRVIGVVAIEALRSVGEPPLTPQEIERRVAPFAADFIGSTRRLVTESLFARGADRVLVQQVAYDMALEPQAVAVPSLRALLATDLTPLLATLHVPVYVINSDLMPTDAARIRKSVPDLTLDVLDHSGHFLMLEDPARFNPLLLKDVAAIAQRAAH